MKNPNIIVVGRSGWGKSTSIRNLDPTKTAIINTERKVLPFPHAAKFLNNVEITTNQQFAGTWAKFNSDPQIEIIVIDSFSSYQEQVLELCRSLYKNFDIWSSHNKMIRENLNLTKNTTKFVVWTGLDEIINLENPGGSMQSLRAIKVDGKELSGKIEKEFVICLFMDARLKEGKMKYSFMTNTDGITSAKSPMGMFPDQFIDNDLNMVINRCKEFYS